MLNARFDLLRGEPLALTASLQDFIAAAAAHVRAQQERACCMPPVGSGGSRLLAGCEGDYLGWEAVELLASRRAATLGRPRLRSQIRARLAEATHRCRRKLSERQLAELAEAATPFGIDIVLGKRRA